MSEVILRDVAESDLPILFEHQSDPEANRMAAFPSRDWDAFMAHWAKVLANDAVWKKAIVFGESVVGNIGCWEQGGEQLVGYWIDRQHWGKGIASRALRLLVREVPIRPLFAHVAKHNLSSIRVLEKCGFTVCGENKGGDDGIVELIMKLERPNDSER